MPAAALPIILDEKLKKVQRSLLAELDFTTWSKSTPSAPATQLALIFSTPPSPLLPLLLPRYDLVWPMSVTRKEGKEEGRESNYIPLPSKSPESSDSGGAS